MIRARTGVIAERADDLGAGDQRADPVGEVDDLLAGDAGEEVLVAAGEADDLVREHRADDEGDVVLDDGPVQRHLRRHGEQPAAQLGDPLGADRAEGRRRSPGSTTRG